MREYIEKTFDWDLEVQRGFITGAAEAEVGKILLIDEEDAGYWNVVESEEEVFLHLVVLLPEFRNRGIGTKLITDLLRDSIKPVRLQVLKVNPARELYERLGFRICADKETYYEMIYDAPLQPQTA
jgi:ribosomal protein S18 acetylase RimI-like enzyme